MTNKTDMEQTYKYLAAHYKYPFEVLLHDTSDREVINKFREHIDSVLFSVSAWQGVNIPGISLSQVAMTRLPFPNPKHEDKEGNQQFDTDIWPEMVERGRQGAGRGNRSEEDICVVVVLDSRIIATKAVKAIAPENMPITESKSVYKAFVRKKILAKQ